MVAPVSDIAFIKLTQHPCGAPIALSIGGIQAMRRDRDCTSIIYSDGSIYYVTETVVEIQDIMINLVVDR